MRMSVHTRGIDRWERDLRSIAASLGRELPSLCAQGARSCAINYGYHSLPYGFDESIAAHYRQMIKVQVATVYAVRDNPSAVYLLIKAVDPLKAEQYWAAHKKGRRRRMADIVNSVSIQKSTDISILKSARTGRNANVPKRTAPKSLVTIQQLRAIQKQQERLVGFAKAGWYQAARKLGRVRRSVDNNGVRTSEQIFPAYIRSLARKHQNIGDAVVRSTADSASATISTNVRHAVNAMPPRRQAQAEASAEDHFRQACYNQLQRIIASKWAKRSTSTRNSSFAA